MSGVWWLSKRLQSSSREREILNVFLKLKNKQVNVVEKMRLFNYAIIRGFYNKIIQLRI